MMGAAERSLQENRDVCNFTPYEILTLHADEKYWMKDPEAVQQMQKII